MADLNYQEMKTTAERARALAQAATPGPWEWPADHCDWFTVVTIKDATVFDINVDSEGRSEEEAHADAEFVARSRDLVPQLSEYVLQLLRRIEELEKK